MKQVKYKRRRKKKHVPFKQWSPLEVLADYEGNWISVENMAQWYGVTARSIQIRIEKGKAIRKHLKTKAKKAWTL